MLSLGAIDWSALSLKPFRKVKFFQPSKIVIWILELLDKYYLLEKIQETSKVLVFNAYSKAVFFEMLCSLRKKYALLLVLKT